MPIDSAPVVSAVVDATATTTTQAVADVAQAATPETVDHIGSVLDTLVSIGQHLNPEQGTTLAIIVAVLVVARMVWKKYKSSKK